MIRLAAALACALLATQTAACTVEEATGHDASAAGRAPTLPLARPELDAGQDQGAAQLGDAGPDARAGCYSQATGLACARPSPDCQCQP